MSPRSPRTPLRMATHGAVLMMCLTAFLFVPAAASSAAPTLPACTKTFAAGSGAWWETNNWSPPGIPSIDDHVCILGAGVVEANTGGTPHIDTLDNHGTILIRGDTFNASIEIGNAGGLSFPLVNDGRIVVESAAGDATLQVDTGSMYNTGNLTTIRSTGTGTSFFVGNMLNTASGSVELGNPSTGLYEANSDDGGIYVNRGQFEIGANVTVSAPFGATFTQARGYLWVAGKLVSSASPILIRVTGGTLKGAGAIENGDVQNVGGTVAPGDNRVGILTIGGDYRQGAGGILAIQVTGAQPGTGYDRLALAQSPFAGGDALLGGTLAIQGAGFTPAIGQAFGILTVPLGHARTGTFATVTGRQAGGGRQYLVRYGTRRVNLVGAA